MKANIDTKAADVLVRPSVAEIHENFPQHIAEKILHHLDQATGDPAKGEVRCVSVELAVFNPFAVEVFYNTLRPNPKGGDPVAGSQFMRFWPNTATMRCLAVTRPSENFGPRVVMVQEYRRQRGAWTQMLVAGGDKRGKALDVLLSELMDESGSKPTSDSRVMRIGREFMDDGVHAEPLDLLTIDMLDAPDSHVFIEEQIKGIALVPWHEWKSKSLRGEYDDVYCTLFAARCDLDRNGHIVVIGKQEVIQ